jgi:hypothetical protein
MRIVFRYEAQRELLEARAWYEERSPGLGFEFARAVDVWKEEMGSDPYSPPILPYL